MKKEDFFEVLGELDDDIVKEAKSTIRENTNRKQASVKWGSVAACLCLAVMLGVGIWHFSSATAGTGESGLYYEKGKYTIVGGSCGGNRDIPSSFDELEACARYSINGEENKNGVIIQCSVDGPSVNRIIEPSEGERDTSKIYGVNHVLTPIKVEKIFYAGSNVNIEEGGVYLVKEPFFYITDESCEPYFRLYGPGTVYAQEYTPLQRGNQYIAYMTLLDDEIYNYNGEPILSLIGLQEAVYCVASEVDAKAVTAGADRNYWTLWEAVMENYAK